MHDEAYGRTSFGQSIRSNFCRGDRLPDDRSGSRGGCSGARFLTILLLSAATILYASCGRAQDGADAQGGREATPSTGAGSKDRAAVASIARLWQPGDPGQRLHVRARLLSTRGTPIGGATIRLWQADGAGVYHPARYRAHLISKPNGEFELTTAVPGQYYGVKHIHVTVSHPQYSPLNTQIFFKGDPNLSGNETGAAILLEEVRSADELVMVGSVEFVMQSP